jgi:hypoxanthine phosphoribosyltransferase
MIQVHDKQFIPYISRQEIDTAIAAVAERINKDYKGKDLLLVIVLKGAMVFASDLLRKITIPCAIETITAKSYGNQTTSSGTVTLVNTLPDVTGKHVLLIEDIVDTGLTLHTITNAMNSYSPLSVEIASLLSKPAMHQVSLPIRYVCFEIPPEFVVGYGLDYAEYGRNLPDIYKIHE